MTNLTQIATFLLSGLAFAILIVLYHALSSYRNPLRHTVKTDGTEVHTLLAPQGNRPADSDPALRAIIACAFYPDKVPAKYRQTGYPDCRIMHRVFTGNSMCAYGCLGLGTCAVVCPNNAIRVSDGTIVVTDACNGCGVCIDICPRKLITLVPVHRHHVTACAAAGKQADAVQWCEIAKQNYRLDFSHFPTSIFKTLTSWFIIQKKRGLSDY